MLNFSLRTVNSVLLYELFSIKDDFEAFDAIGDIHSNHGNRILTYIKDDKYIPIINENNNLAGVICTPAIAGKLADGLVKVLHHDPVLAFFSLVDYFGKKIGTINSSVILSDICAHQVSIAPFDVYVGKNVKIEPNVVILPGVVIEDNVVIRAGAVLGIDSFQHQRTTQGIFSPHHDGLLHIKSHVEIGANSTMSRGFSYRNTVIAEHNKIDAQTYIAHGTQIGNGNIICAGARIMGHVSIGDNGFIGPGSVISSRLKIGNNVKVSLGAVVTKNIHDGQHVTGNFAIEHEKFLTHLKKYI
ncbi:DapH/DapD/GlmU-related protein [Erwinia rhapontici]|uniref:DapH/DapD/GlmU-related protein n=1 Tax=Erwinia rhapontici TaxID=55212 RepID=UPI002167FE8E|nr:DapH/DapD/GlmU-related protein [Erwinia rhapontici]MCS3607580.1 UDP-3-O-[3-hydroxymyristoyl] glucosamine N-acyltransferase [Erwinia rhapontici]